MYEFVMLFRHIESEKFQEMTETKVIQLYEDSADLVIKGEKKMSYDKFVIVCVENYLFTDK